MGRAGRLHYGCWGNGNPYQHGSGKRGMREGTDGVREGRKKYFAEGPRRHCTMLGFSGSADRMALFAVH